MRKKMVKTGPYCGAVLAAALLIPLVCGDLASGQQSPAKEETPQLPPPQVKEKPTPAKPEKDAVPSLKELLTQVLKDNPDIRVAETKLREAEADLNRTRLQVTRKVVALHQALKSQRSQVEAAEAKYQYAEAELQRFKGLQKGHTAPQQLVDEQQAKLEAAKAALMAAKAQLAQTEADLPYLLGQYPRPLSSNSKAEEARNLQAVEDALRLQMMTLEFEAILYKQKESFKGKQAASPPLPGAMTDKIRKALNTPVKLEVERTPLSEVLAYLSDRTGASFHLKSSNLAKEEVSFQLKEAVPLAAALQAIGDVLPKARFLVRDYGILVADSDTLPPGAISVENFWKTPPTQAVPAPGVGPSRKQLPPEGLNGTVQEIEPKSGLVVLSFGRDVDLPDGTVLEVYRLRPKPAYVGRIRVEKVRPALPTQELARPVAPLQSSAIQVGDQVSTKISKGS